MARLRRAATRSTLKTLFALSRNVCAMPRCESKLTDPSWPEVFGEVAHIHAERPGGPRWDPDLSDAQRWAFENLMVVCPSCHKLIDRIAPQQYPADALREIKRRHEERAADARPWGSEQELDRIVAAVMKVLVASDGDLTAAVMFALSERLDAGRTLMRSPHTVDVVSAIAAVSGGSGFTAVALAEYADLDRDVIYGEIRRLARAGLVRQSGRRGVWVVTDDPFWATV